MTNITHLGVLSFIITQQAELSQYITHMNYAYMVYLSLRNKTLKGIFPASDQVFDLSQLLTNLIKRENLCYLRNGQLISCLIVTQLFYRCQQNVGTFSPFSLVFNNCLLSSSFAVVVSSDSLSFFT